MHFSNIFEIMQLMDMPRKSSVVRDFEKAEQLFLGNGTV
jgi:hypothetical protein